MKFQKAVKLYNDNWSLNKLNHQTQQKYGGLVKEPLVFEHHIYWSLHRHDFTRGLAASSKNTTSWADPTKMEWSRRIFGRKHCRGRKKTIHDSMTQKSIWSLTEYQEYPRWIWIYNRTCKRRCCLSCLRPRCGQLWMFHVAHPIPGYLMLQPEWQRLSLGSQPSQRFFSMLIHRFITSHQNSGDYISGKLSLTWFRPWPTPVAVSRHSCQRPANHHGGSRGPTAVDLTTNRSCFGFGYNQNSVFFCVCVKKTTCYGGKKHVFYVFFFFLKTKNKYNWYMNKKTKSWSQKLRPS